MISKTIQDLPNELLDEIFSYVVPEIYDQPIIPIQTVCRRWNRPFMTQMLWNDRLPANIDLRAKFPKLTIFQFYPNAKYYNDFSFFKGHAFVKVLDVYRASLVPSVLNCPRLASLTLEISSKDFFQNEHLAIFLSLLPRLEYLDITLYSTTEWDIDLIPSFDQKLATLLQNRTRTQLKLKHLIISCPDMDFEIFGSMFQTTSLDRLQIRDSLSLQHGRKVLEFFPNMQSLGATSTSLLYVTDAIFERITSFSLMVDSEFETWTFHFSSLLKRFPNIESLYVTGIPIVFDLEHPTRLTSLKMTFTDSFQPRLFPLLTTLDWIIPASQFNDVMRELGEHCPHLTVIKMNPAYRRKSWIVLELDNIEFPLLEKLHLDRGFFKFNSSLVRFLARHGQLKSLLFDNYFDFDDDLKFVDSDQILWPYLREMRSHCIDDRKRCQRQVRDWFVKNAPRV